MAEALIISLKDQLDDQLTCSVCLDQYTNPKTLPCHHSFCLECIQPLPVKIKDRKYYISCPTCCADHPVPQGGSINFPNAFQINSLLDIRRKFGNTQQTTSSSTNCPKHNDPLKMYCETCCQVICCECTISEEHSTHDFSLISKCYSKHHQQILENLGLVKHKIADINTATTDLATREREVIQQGQQLKEQINTHAQQIIDQVQKSQTLLSQQVDTIVQQKMQVLKTQRQQAQKLHTQLENCQEMIEHSLKEWTKQQILAEKHTMMAQMNTATQHIDTAALQPRENADIQFIKTDVVEEIGLVTMTQPSATKQEPTSAVINQSHNVTTLLSQSTLSSTGDVHSVKSEVKSDMITQTLTQTSYKAVGKPINILTGVNRPCGIAVCANGDVVVAERGIHCITILSKDNENVRTSFGALGSNKGQFVNCQGVAITNDGHILVTDHHRLQKLTSDGVCVKSVGSSEFTGKISHGSGNGRLQFNYPHGIMVLPTTGQIFVADKWNNRIQVFTNDLTFSRTITLHDDSKKFRYPHDIALDNEGYLYVTESGNHCITKLTSTGQYITRFGSRGSAPGQLFRPSSLTINNNLVYVSERGNHRVSIFDTTGKFLHCFGKKGSEVEFNKPIGIATDNSGNLYVSDQHNNRIVVCNCKCLLQS